MGQWEETLPSWAALCWSDSCCGQRKCQRAPQMSACCLCIKHRLMSASGIWNKRWSRHAKKKGSNLLPENSAKRRIFSIKTSWDYVHIWESKCLLVNTGPHSFQSVQRVGLQCRHNSSQRWEVFPYPALLLQEIKRSHNLSILSRFLIYIWDFFPSFWPFS